MSLKMGFWLAAVLLLQAAGAGASSPDDPVLVSSPEQIPEWAQQGKFHFTRVDGGPLEALKTSRSQWGKHFSDAQKEVLANLYTKYGDRVIELLEQAHVNFVWLTWSVGYSWQDEAEQREQCQRFVARLHARGIHSAAYVCAVSMFWESMFRDEPRSVRWITLDPKGVPYRYSGGRDPLRFLADPSNPEWIELVKRRVDAAIDAGFDAIFFDNAASRAMEPFLGEIRRHIRSEKKSKILFSANHGLIPGPIQLVRGIEDFIFAEGWHEPGVWGSEWNTSNIRRTKYLRGAIPEWKPLTTEYSMFHEGDRATTFLAPRSQKLATAEAAVFQSDHSWDMEGPFAGALMTNDPAALAAWKAIGDYRRFLSEHEELYWKARALSSVAVIMPTTGVSITWERDETGLFELLSRNSVLYDIRLASARDRDQLRAYEAVVVPPGVELTPALVEYQNGGGKLYRATHADERAIAEIRALTAGAPSLAIEGAPHVVGNITRLGSDEGLAVHLLNYDSEPVSGVRVRVNPGKQFSGLAVDPHVMTPDGRGAVTGVRLTGTGIEFTLDRLDVYTAVVLRPAAAVAPVAHAQDLVRD